MSNSDRTRRDGPSIKQTLNCSTFSWRALFQPTGYCISVKHRSVSEEHGLEAYATLTFRSVERCLKSTRRKLHEPKAITRRANVA